MDRMDAFHRITMLGGYLKPVLHVDGSYYQHPILLSDLAHDLSDQVVILQRDLARCQRAGEGARQSTTRGCDDIIDGGSMWLQRFFRQSVVLSDRAMHSEFHRFGFGGNLCRAEWTAEPPNSDV